MKGTSIAINTVILLVLAIVVLAALIGSFILPIREQGEGMDCQGKLEVGCNHFVSRQCCENSCDELPPTLIEGLECTGVSDPDLADARDACC